MYKNIVTQTLRKPLFKSMEISADVLRLDLIHPVISGNKWYKLKYHISNALDTGKKGIVTSGGAYSNHLVATAVACREHNLLSAGFIRGEPTWPENESIRQMKGSGMELFYISREEYRKKDNIISEFLLSHPDYYYVPEGGCSVQGIKGAGEILENTDRDYTHIICPIGTGTTMAGLINASSPTQNVFGICCLKIVDRTNNELEKFLSIHVSKNNYTIVYDYHFGGYAKKTDELIAFMNQLYAEENIPTDFVYTGKMFYGIYDLVTKKYFPHGSRLLLIHTGGLQGNRSLTAGTLVFS